MNQMEKKLRFLGNHDKLIIVLHEIYGINEHMETICNHYSRQGFDVICPNLFNSKRSFNYDQEELAYKYFMKQVGFSAAVSHVKQLVNKMKPKYKAVLLLGFSIGATIAWICSEESDSCMGVIGYYGSRIRDYLDLNPVIPVLLFYPENEGFDLAGLQKELSLKEKVKVSVLKGKHGFSNPFSSNYCPLSDKLALKETADFLQKLTIN
jgi:dienelactone hydrolase